MTHNDGKTEPVPGPSRPGPAPPLKVLHTLRTDDPRAGGFVTYVDSLREGLADRPVELASESVFPTNRNWRVVAVRHPLRFLARLGRRLGEVDALHLHGIFGWHVLLSAWAAIRANKPYVLTLHGHLHPDAMRERYWAKRLYLALAGRTILDRAAAVLVTVPDEEACLGSHVTNATVREVLPGLTVPETPRAQVASAPRGGRRLRILYLGRLHPHKGLHLVVRALGEALRRGLDPELVVAGAGRPWYRRRLERLARCLGLDTRMRFVGHVGAREREMLLATSDLFVLPSRSENFGYAVAEAMAAGVPVVVSRNVGLAPLVERWRCGSVVPVEDAETLERTLLEYADPARRGRRARRAHRAAREAFSIPAMGATMARTYREACGAPAVPRPG